MKDYTVKEIAEIIEVSKPTVQKVIKDLSIDPVRIEKNKYRFYCYADVVKVIKSIRSDFDFEKLQNGIEKSQNETEKSENFSEKQPNETEKPQNETAKQPSGSHSDELDLMRSMLSLIQEQMKEKDKQLAIKDKQIQDLNDRLAEAMELTKGIQYITAADKTVQLMEKSEAEDVRFAADVIVEKEAAAADQDIREEQPPQKKGFWGKIFKK